MALSYLNEAFGIVWIVFILYIINLIRQHRALEDQIKMLESMK